ncbi:MAG TPA: hypothetical protein VGI19_18400 [Candidatus Cybelea sp.]|jgi:hypothetical protein
MEQFKKRVALGALSIASVLFVVQCSGNRSVMPIANPGGAGVGDAAAGVSGHVLIADQWNNRIIEVGRNHRIVWHFGDGSAVAGPTSVVGPNDAERYGDGLTLIAGSGLPAGTIKACSSKPCPDNRVLVVNMAGSIVWQYGKAGVSGSGPDRLNVPVGAIHLPNGDVMVTDQGNQRVVEITRAKKIVWQYGTTGKAGHGPNELNNPNSAMVLANGHILIADESNNRVIEVAKDKKIVWQYGSPKDTKTLNGAAYACRLDSGDTLIPDSLNSRVIEVDASKKTVWSYKTNKQRGSIKQPQTAHAVRLKNGDTLIANQIDNEVIEVTSSGKIVWQQGKIGPIGGKKFNEVNWPYDAKVVGDYTGITPP